MSYILGNFKTVGEVKSALTNPADPKYAAVWAEPLVQKLAPLHLLVRDAEGKSLIVEWIEGKQLIYDGPAVDEVGVLTNDPPYPQQVKELANLCVLNRWDEGLGTFGFGSAKPRHRGSLLNRIVRYS